MRTSRALFLAAVALALASPSRLRAVQVLPVEQETAQVLDAERVSTAVADLASKDTTATLNLILVYPHPPGTATQDNIEDSGGEVRETYSLINAVHVAVRADKVGALLDDPTVSWVAWDAPLSGQLDVARKVVKADVLQLSQLGLLSTPAAPTGKNVTVAVVDSGIAPHPDLSGRILKSVDFTGGGEVITVASDPYGHGTHVAGIVAGSGARSLGLERGLAKGASVVSLRVLDAEGQGTTSALLRALDWVVQNKDLYRIKVVNLSLGHPVFDPVDKDPLVLAVEKAWQAGTVVVCSAGNWGTYGNFSVSSPGVSPRAITVGSVTDWNTVDAEDDIVSTYSSRGPTAFDHFMKPDLLAPGNKIVSLRAPGSTLDVTYPQWRKPGLVGLGDDSSRCRERAWPHPWWREPRP